MNHVCFVIFVVVVVVVFFLGGIPSAIKDVRDEEKIITCLSKPSIA